MGSSFAENPLLPELPNLPEIASTDLQDFGNLIGRLSVAVGGAGALGAAGAASGATATAATATAAGGASVGSFSGLLGQGLEFFSAREEAKAAAKRDQQQAMLDHQLELARIQSASAGAGALNAIPLPRGLSPMLLVGGGALLLVALMLKK